jgi:hypothetical protein
VAIRLPLVAEPSERLGADDAATLEIDDRLERDAQALALNQAPDAARLVLTPAPAEVDDLLLTPRPLALDLEPAAGHHAAATASWAPSNRTFTLTGARVLSNGDMVSIVTGR